jgi:phytoene dehydrogenase-like protein
MADPYHAIVVGGGHNGLVAGSYLARSGARTMVLEARSKVGGAVDTSAPFPDYPEIKVSTYSYVMSLMPAFIVEQLELANHGYRVTRSVRTTRRSPKAARSRSTATTRSGPLIR